MGAYTRAGWRCMQLVYAIMMILQPLDVMMGLPTTVGYYDRSCPDAESIVKSTVQAHTEADITIPAALLRLHFHDCFVQGCDGSVLIDGANVEKTAITNLGLRGFEVIEDAKSKVEAVCPGVVSCADILALAARDAVELSDGPSWNVPLGRRDGRVSSASDASNLPSPLDSILTLKLKFASKGLSVEDLVLLSGAHTIGQTECRFFSYRLYNYSLTGQADPSMDSQFVQEMKGVCPRSANGLNKVALDKGSQTTFDTSYFNNIINGYGILESDQKLMSDDTTSNYVQQYAQTKNNNGGVIGGLVGGLIGGLLGGGSSKSSSFNDAFARSMVKMGNVGVLIGNQGEIRKACSSFN